MAERELTPEENAVVQELYRRKGGFGSPGNKPTHAYVTVTKDVPLAWANPDQRGERMVPPGATLKIVMVSRFGDCGLTDDLEADHGYMIRFQFTDPTIVDIRWQPTPTKEWKEFLSQMTAKVLDA